MDKFETLIYQFPQQGTILRTEALEIPGVEGARPLTLYLPPDFEERGNSFYPVAYLFDGQNLYDGQSQGPEGWHLHRVLDERWLRGLRVPVVIGIHHGPDRDAELSPWQIENAGEPRGEALLAWLVSELHPWALEYLPIRTEPEHTLLGGSSLGGLMALYGSLKYQHIFGQGLCMSPSLWVGEGAVYDYVATVGSLQNPESVRLYLDAGRQEGAAAEGEPIRELGDSPVRDSRALVGLLEQLGLERETHFRWVEDPEGEHNEYHWHKRLPLALDFFYGSGPLSLTQPLQPAEAGAQPPEALAA